MVPHRVLRFALLGLIALLVGLGSGCSSTLPSGASRSQALEDHVNLGLRYLADGNRQRARLNLQRAMEIDGRSPAAHHGMAMLFQVETEYELAEEHFRKALSYDRDFTLARNNYAAFLYARERYEDAYVQLKEAAEDVHYRNRFQVFHSLGVVAIQLGRDEEAREAFEKSLALAPGYALPHLELSEYYFARGDLATARRHLDAYDKAAQPQPRSLWLAVRILHQLGDSDGVASKGLALTKLFPDAQETRQYKAWLNDEKQD